MMTFREARERCAVNNCSLRRTGWGDYRVTHRTWRDRIEERAYYTDDLEDAALTSAKLVGENRA